VFGNYEGRLPKRARGYYHEYTVETPGSNDRGARRIITGGEPPVEYFYTSDHYQSIKPIEATR
jgi:guanyl-specific ribonuclease Sa